MKKLGKCLRSVQDYLQSEWRQENWVTKLALLFLVSMIAISIYLISRKTGNYNDQVFEIISKSMEVSSGLIIASGVIYTRKIGQWFSKLPPNTPAGITIQTLSIEAKEFEEHVVEVFTFASRRCVIGILGLIAITVLEVTHGFIK